ncbi:MAG TPA: MnhB domain-containing protein [Marmoricola sp.]|nr:MnhB domain-containing protein [Marmoricola sp.]
MSARMSARLVLLTLGVAGVAAVLAVGFGALPHFGDVHHGYGVRAVAAAISHKTANAVGSVTFDQRAFDTAGEELIMFAASTSALMLLRRIRDEDEGEAAHDYDEPDVQGALRLSGTAFLPVTLLVGCYVIAHGHLSPGGGFQGGVVLATGLHLAYLAGDYKVLERLRPSAVFDVAEAGAVAGYLGVGLVGLGLMGSFLADWIPLGTFGSLLSAGTVPVLNGLVGIEVGAALVLLVARFLDQALLIRREHDDG